MSNSIESVWADIRKSVSIGVSSGRHYRSLGTSAVGIRASMNAATDQVELMVEVPPDWNNQKVLPQWQGLSHEVVELSILPRLNSIQLVFQPGEYEDSELFVLFCNSIVADLEGILDQKERIEILDLCLLRWRQFFRSSGSKGLSLNGQQGLYAELQFLDRLLRSGMSEVSALSSWKGCERAIHDFEINENVIEVKSTRSKAPEKVRISNEQQLNDMGLAALHLFVVHVRVSSGNGLTLSEKVSIIQDDLLSGHGARQLFRNQLKSAGYVKEQADFYSSMFSVTSEALFEVKEGFPRIIEVPTGVAEISYDILLDACEPFRTDVSRHISKIAKGK